MRHGAPAAAAANGVQARLKVAANDFRHADALLRQRLLQASAAMMCVGDGGTYDDDAYVGDDRLCLSQATPCAGERGEGNYFVFGSVESHVPRSRKGLRSLPRAKSTPCDACGTARCKIYTLPNLGLAYFRQSVGPVQISSVGCAGFQTGHINAKLR